MVSVFLLIDAFFSLLFRAIRFLYRPVYFLQTLVIGFFLGFFDRKDLQRIDEQLYNKRPLYLSDAHNKAPLFDWEEAALKQYFEQGSRILVTAVGGGREAYNLHQMGYKVHAYEYNPQLRAYGNAFFQREGLPIEIGKVERDAFPLTDLTFDGIIIGWGAYTHMKGRALRIQHLKEAYALLKPGGTLLVSFWAWRFRYLNLKRIQQVGNWMAKRRGNDPVELGDVILPEFCHYFKAKDIEDELNAAGFDFLFYDDSIYGHAIARKADSNAPLG